MTKTKLNIESWNRKEHFRFFSAFDDPFFGITTNVDFTTIYLEAKHDSQSFFLYSLHHILTKANETDEFKLRIEGGNSVVKYDTIHDYRFRKIQEEKTLSDTLLFRGSPSPK